MKLMYVSGVAPIISDDMKQCAKKMLDIITDKDSDEQEKNMAFSTLDAILHPLPEKNKSASLEAAITKNLLIKRAVEDFRDLLGKVDVMNDGNMKINSLIPHIQMIREHFRVIQTTLLKNLAAEKIKDVKFDTDENTRKYVYNHIKICWSKNMGMKEE